MFQAKADKITPHSPHKRAAAPYPEIQFQKLDVLKRSLPLFELQYMII